MLKLLNPNPELRMSVVDCSKHYWFYNLKQKMKGSKKSKHQKYSINTLRTIIELREQSEMDLRQSLL